MELSQTSTCKHSIQDYRISPYLAACWFELSACVLLVHSSPLTRHSTFSGAFHFVFYRLCLTFFHTADPFSIPSSCLTSLSSSWASGEAAFSRSTSAIKSNYGACAVELLRMSLCSCFLTITGTPLHYTSTPISLPESDKQVSVIPTYTSMQLHARKYSIKTAYYCMSSFLGILSFVNVKTTVSAMSKKKQDFVKSRVSNILKTYGG